jgi:hypothetical protein
VKRRQLERHPRDHGCTLHHHGAKHDIWLSPATLAQASVTRHAEIKRGSARGICRILGIPGPSRI